MLVSRLRLEWGEDAANRFILQATIDELFFGERLIVIEIQGTEKILGNRFHRDIFGRFSRDGEQFREQGDHFLRFDGLRVISVEQGEGIF